MALTNRERIGRMLEYLAKGLRPIVEREFRQVYGANWPSVVAAQKEAATGFGSPADVNDPQFLLNALQFHWKETLGRSLGASERNYVAELRDTRNRWAHPRSDKPFSNDDVYRAYDTAERLLRAVAAPEAQDLLKAKAAVLQEAVDAARKQKQREGVGAATQAQPAKGLPPWREVVTPHPDVAAGRYRQAEFAADLDQVSRGTGSSEYVDPREFFSRTYLTEGLRLLLVGALRRLSDTGGESVVDLQTAFGGGKTHSMLALYHLSDPKVDVSSLPGLEPVLKEAGVSALPNVTRAVLVGTALSPVSPRTVDGTTIRTLWGELAWRLGGAKSFELVGAADAAGVPPGGDVLRELLGQHSPVLILVDEWVTYARLQYGSEGLPGGTFDSALSFTQQLTQAVGAVPGAMLVVSLPSSLIEVGGEGGQKALESLKHVVHRIDAPWKPAAAQESFEIVRRRLFEPISGEAARTRDEVTQRFSELYAANAGGFPSDTKERAYLDRLRSCYPIHPELFDRLFDDWSTLERFQRTRGVLKLMAAVVHALWERQDPNLLILPGAVPLDDATVLPQLTQYLSEHWSPIIEGDVDGPNSLPLRLDRENPAYGRYSAARRVGRTVFMGSAPLPDAANRGIDDKRILLGTAQPGETPATFGDALRKLASTATYLYEDRGRYWYSTQPSVNQLARDRAEGQSKDRVEQEIETRLKKALTRREPFRRVHVAPRTASDVPDEPEVSLVVLGPEFPHDTKGAESKASQAAAAFLAERGAGPRTNQNMLIFMAPDATRLAELDAAVRDYLAWTSIVEDGKNDVLDLGGFQKSQAESQAKSANQTVDSRIPETYQWLLVPEQKDGVGTVALKPVKVSGSEELAVRASRKLMSEELLIAKWGGVNLRLTLDQKLGEYWNANHQVGLAELWSWFAKYVYLPRLLDRSVLEGAVRDGVGNLLWRSETFAYAAVREEGGEYRGVVAGAAKETPVTSTSVLVHPSAIGELPDDRRGEKPPEPLIALEPQERVTRRFHGEFALSEPRRPIPELSRIAEEVIARLAMHTEVNLRVRLEVDAEHKGTDGFKDDTIRTVSENARTLRSTGFEWEKD